MRQCSSQSFPPLLFVDSCAQVSQCERRRPEGNRSLTFSRYLPKQPIGPKVSAHKRCEAVWRELIVFLQKKVGISLSNSLTLPPFPSLTLALSIISGLRCSDELQEASVVRIVTAIEPLRHVHDPHQRDETVECHSMDMCVTCAVTVSRVHKREWAVKCWASCQLEEGVLRHDPGAPLGPTKHKHHPSLFPSIKMSLIIPCMNKNIVHLP